MKKFLYGRLHDPNNGYDFYIRPGHSIDPLLAALSTDLIPDAKPIVFIYSQNGRIIFGVREQLTLKDDFGRLRANFMGYQLESDEAPLALPFLDELQAKLPEITAEAHECHRLLDEDPTCGDCLRETSIQFGHGHHQADNDWDNAVMRIRKNPTLPLLLMFDEQGKAMSLPPGIALSSNPISSKPPVETALDTRASPFGAFSANQGQANKAGILSTVTLSDGERIKLPPPPDLAMRKKKSGFLGSAWEMIGGKKLVECLKNKKRKKGDFFPSGPEPE
jgi:hypothetical protein